MLRSRLHLFSLLLLLIGMLHSCESAEVADGLSVTCNDGIQNGDEVGIDCGGSCGRFCPVYENPLGGEIVWRTVLRTGGVYTLTEPLLIRDESMLEIQPGVTIKVVPNVGAYIAVGQGGQLNIYGSAEQPVIFESLSDNPSAGDWGGIQVMGQAITNESGVRLTEVGNYLYGGGDDLDYSVRLTYVKIYHAGQAIKQSSMAALGLYGVGSQSIIDQVEISQALGGGVRIVGGTANLHRLYLNDLGEGIRISNGWRGNFQKTFISNIASSPFQFEEYMASEEPNNNGLFEDLTFLGPTKGSLVQFKTGGADLDLENWYVSQIGSFLSLDEDAFNRIDSLQVNPIYFTGSAVNLINPTSINTDFIVQSENQGAGSGAEKPVWLNWTN
jgi:hypothetical protein